MSSGSVSNVLLHGLSFEGGEALGVVDRGVDAVLDTGLFLGFLGVVPAVESTDEVAGDAAEALELAFLEPFGVVVEVFLHGIVARFLADELHADFDEAGDVHGLVLIEFFQSFFYLFVADFGVSRNGFSESF